MYALSRRETHDASRVFSRHSHSSKLAKVIDTGMTVGTLFGWGLVNGRFGVIAPLGISLDLIVGVLAGAGGLFVKHEKFAAVSLNIGTGSLGSFAMRKGVQLGTSMRTAAGLPALAAADLGTGIFGGDFARGAIATGAARDLSEAELRAMTRAAAR